MAPAMSLASDVLTVTATGDSASRRISAAGEVDASSAGHLAAAVDAALTDGARQLLLDLTAVTFLGVAGVRAVAEAQRHASGAGVQLRTRVGHPAVRWPLVASGVWQLLAAEWAPAHARP